MNAETNNKQPDTGDQPTNGRGNGYANGHSPDERYVKKAIFTERSAECIKTGDVRTFIFPERKSWGETTFTVRQVREGVNGQFVDAFRTEDVQDMLRGAYKAQRWITKRQRALGWRALVAGLL